ncbi:IclR family transcriptional regulator [Vagococcus sp. PNs007]|uniref:IclR family transcriptional regulator n=1 Tax=Vagococcus proximus TaxID=2991417 RepID=A0ABT5X2H1_9ENTE|nr:IclR family transcriptional regulator [Vagococcus proximus]MDF0480200.1 IclR family transcriptional regulator [Vagococcus proximus]
MTKSPIIKNITDAFEILDLLNNHQEMGVTEITERTGLSKTTVFRLIKSLEAVHAIKQKPDQKYILDYQIAKYAQNAGKSDQLSNLAEPFMKEIREQTGESVNLGVEYEDEVLIINTIEGEFYQLQTTLLPVSPLYCSGMGKLFLSQWSDNDLEAYFKTVRARTVNTLTDVANFKKEQQQIKVENIAVDNEEYEYGLSCYAVPIYNKNQKLVCSLSVSGPTSRLKSKGIDKLVKVLKEQAALFQQVI